MSQYPQNNSPRMDTVGVQPGARPYLHTIEAGAKLPLLQSVVWGLVAGTMTLVIALSNHPRWPGCLLWSVAVFLIGFALAWMFYQRHWFRLSSLERLTGLDPNGDGVIGAETRQAQIITRIELVDPGPPWHSQIFDLPATDKQLTALAAGINAGVPFAEAYWTGRGGPFSVKQFRSLRAELVRRKLLAAANPDAPAQGYALTAAGRAILKHYSPALHKETAQ
jgi:hypothetical protein